MSSKLLEGKNALITGAGQNIGRSIALEMAGQGANIFFTDIHEERGRKLEKQLNQFEVTAKWFHSDISRTEDIEELGKAVSREQREIHILVNNVGIQTSLSPIRNMPKEEFPRIFGTNVFGPIYLTKIISQMMIEKQTQGSIIFMTSIHQDTLRGTASYSSSKAALTMVIKELAMELAAFQIRVNGIRPGGVWEDDEGNPRPFKQSPLHGTTINPSYIGRGAVYLASDYFSKFTTGTILTIDGGLSLHSYLTL
jgi:NAD(P)-dependent dehydrogenase (short-subunit alcohol dehydrogenase family)